MVVKGRMRNGIRSIIRCRSMMAEHVDGNVGAMNFVESNPL